MRRVERLLCTSICVDEYTRVRLSDGLLALPGGQGYPYNVPHRPRYLWNLGVPIDAPFLFPQSLVLSSPATLSAQSCHSFWSCYSFCLVLQLLFLSGPVTLSVWSCHFFLSGPLTLSVWSCYPFCLVLLLCLVLLFCLVLSLFLSHSVTLPGPVTLSSPVTVSGPVTLYV